MSYVGRARRGPPHDVRDVLVASESRGQGVLGRYSRGTAVNLAACREVLQFSRIICLPDAGFQSV